MDAWKKSGGGLANLHQAKNVPGALTQIRLVSIFARIYSGLQGSVRDHSLFHRLVDARASIGDSCRRRLGSRGSCRGRRAASELQSAPADRRSEEHTSELPSLMRISYA